MAILGPPSVVLGICLGKCEGIIDLDPKDVLVFSDTNGVYYVRLLPLSTQTKLIRPLTLLELA